LIKKISTLEITGYYRLLLVYRFQKGSLDFLFFLPAGKKNYFFKITFSNQ